MITNRCYKTGMLGLILCSAICVAPLLGATGISLLGLTCTPEETLIVFGIAGIATLLLLAVHLFRRRRRSLPCVSRSCPQTRENEPPIACDLTAIPGDERPLHDMLARSLVFGKPLKISDLPNGYALQYPVTELNSISQWITKERLCCPFLTFRLEVAEELVTLELTGSSGTKDLLKDIINEYGNPKAKQ